MGCSPLRDLAQGIVLVKIAMERIVLKMCQPELLMAFALEWEQRSVALGTVLQLRTC